jgi:hypothetical protein
MKRFRAQESMLEPLPPRDGDVVIVHLDSVPTAYDVWLVIEDGQQARHEKLFQPMRVHDQVFAEQLARAFVTAAAHLGVQAGIRRRAGVGGTVGGLPDTPAACRCPTVRMPPERLKDVRLTSADSSMSVTCSSV